jgi:ADP-ribose pyrophosphatase YjhB (NUDIX family)
MSPASPRRDYPDRPIVGVGAVIIHQQRVVLIKRGAPPLQGEWSLPGGVVELGETLRAAAEREAREETGLIVRAGQVLEVLDRIIPGRSDVSEDHGRGGTPEYPDQGGAPEYHGQSEAPESLGRGGTPEYPGQGGAPESPGQGGAPESPSQGGAPEYHYVLIDFLCRVEGGELRAGGDAAGAIWATESELREFKLEQPALEVIRKALEISADGAP